MKQTPGANIKGLAWIQAGCVPSGMLTDSGEKEEGISEDTSETGWERGGGGGAGRAKADLTLF